MKRYNEQQKELLLEQISTINSYKFQVEVTKSSDNKGVDVIGKAQVGITTITEVVQVKRMQNTITRPYIDQLHGALPYHKAIYDTIITTGNFAAQCTHK